MSRIEDRAGFDNPTRLRLLERDMDDQELAMDRLDAKLSRILWAIWSLVGAVVIGLISVNLTLVFSG